MNQKTIFINGRFLTKTVTGVQRYSRELLRQMDFLLNEDRFSQRVKFVCLVPREAFQQPGWQNIEIRPVGLNNGNLWEQVDLPLYARGELLFSPANIGPFYYRNQVVTFHDASVFAVPQAYSRTFRAKYTFILRNLSRNARLILTDSHFSQRELARYLGVTPERFQVISPGGDHLDPIQSDIKILEQYHLKKNAYLLLVASRSPHKNLGSVFEALKSVNTDMKVVFVGESFGQVFQRTEYRLLPPNVETLGYVPDGQLKALYENALGFIFPSMYEGFGLPVLEAMHCGCPVLCSNAASLPEVAGDAALYFDPYQVDQIAQTLNDFLSKPQSHEQLRLKGRQHAAGFKWSMTAQKVLEVLLNSPIH